MNIIKKVIEVLGYNLEYADGEDIEDALLEIEQSFGLKFETEDLVSVKTYSEMCDVIRSKIKCGHAEDCTSQQAFYKLRKAISLTIGVEEHRLLPGTLIGKIFPKKNRIKYTKILERNLGMKLSILSIPNWAVVFLAMLTLGILVTFFFNWRLAAFGVVWVVLGFWLGNLFGKEVGEMTISDLVEKMTTTHYLKSRRSPGTVNENEIQKIITRIFCAHLGLEPAELTRDSKLRFGW